MNPDSNPSQAALLVIDVQRGLFEKSTPVYQAELFLKNLNILIAKARAQSVPVIFVQHANDSFLQKGLDAWQLHPAIQPMEAELIIHKCHGDAFVETDLQAELDKSNVGVLVVTGLVTQGCVRATSLGALSKGYQVILVSDGHSTYSKGAAKIIQQWNQTLSEKGANLTETKDIDFVGVHTG
ncbi:MAG: isochorismatase family protein [Anaerolineales bacterium]|nr:isochorismatase family protein [Anaerolineales bacterium]